MSSPAQPSDHLALRFLASPAGPTKFAVAAAPLVVLFTIYCQIYCATAYHPMHGATMPLRFSFVWAIGAVLPWLACFEICKSSPVWAARPLVRYVGIAFWFLAAAMLSVVLELGLDRLVSAHTRPLQMQIAAQLPAAALVMLLLLLARSARFSPAIGEYVEQPTTPELRLGSNVEWIEAAGNYVQVHGGGRTSLHRVTMRQLEATMDRSAFARIHRSTIVAAKAIDARVLVSGDPAVRLRDGTLLKIGSRFARNLDSLCV